MWGFFPAIRFLYGPVRSYRQGKRRAVRLKVEAERGDNDGQDEEKTNAAERGKEGDRQVLHLARSRRMRCRRRSLRRGRSGQGSLASFVGKKPSRLRTGSSPPTSPLEAVPLSIDLNLHLETSISVIQLDEERMATSALNKTWFRQARRHADTTTLGPRLEALECPRDVRLLQE